VHVAQIEICQRGGTSPRRTIFVSFPITESYIIELVELYRVGIRSSLHNYFWCVSMKKSAALHLSLWFAAPCLYFLWDYSIAASHCVDVIKRVWVYLSHKCILGPFESVSTSPNSRVWDRMNDMYEAYYVWMIIDVGTKSDLIGNQRRSGYAIHAAFFLIAK